MECKFLEQKYGRGSRASGYYLENQTENQINPDNAETTTSRCHSRVFCINFVWMNFQRDIKRERLLIMSIYFNSHFCHSGTPKLHFSVIFRLAVLKLFGKRLIT